MGTHKRILKLKLSKSNGMTRLSRQKGYAEAFGILVIFFTLLSLLGCLLSDCHLTVIPFIISLLLLTPVANRVACLATLLEAEGRSLKGLEEKEKAFLEGHYID